jgi:hypothetical protein
MHFLIIEAVAGKKAIALSQIPWLGRHFLYFSSYETASIDTRAP